MRLHPRCSATGPVEGPGAAPLRTDGLPAEPLSTALGAAYRPVLPIPAEEEPVSEEQQVDEAVAEETLVEEVSIDGMCGVY